MNVVVRMPIIRDILLEATNFGAPLTKTLPSCGLNLDALNDAERWVDLEQGHLVWQTVVAVSQDAFIGMKIGQKSNPYVIGVLGYLMESSPDVRTCLKQLYTYNPVFGNMFLYNFEEVEDQLIVTFQPAAEWQRQYPETARQAVETSMSRSIAILRQFTGRAIWPTQAYFNYAKPLHAGQIYEKILQCTTHFEANKNALCFDRKVAELPLKSFNPLLFQQFSDLAQASLDKIREVETLQAQTYQLLFSQLGEQLLSLEQVATHFNLSVRTFQRKLQEEETTFQEIVDRLRKKVAEQLLDEKGTTVEEVAHFLGYSEASVFRRAFKRWTGQSPSVFRAK